MPLSASHQDRHPAGDRPAADPRIPIALLTGFLGSGKTTRRTDQTPPPVGPTYRHALRRSPRAARTPAIPGRRLTPQPSHLPRDMDTDPIPNSYAAWKHCITVECRILLTHAFVEQRLAVWQNPNLEETQRFRRSYGDDHWRRVTEWFLQARTELNETVY